MGIAIGAATGAVSSAITGGNVLEGALMGAVMGGVTGGMGGLGAGGLSSGLGSSVGFSTTAGLFNSAGLMVASNAAMAGSAILGLGGSVAMGYLTPKQQDYSQYYQGAYNPIAYNTQQSQITGSGGRQAPALLAAEIKRAKKRREGQAAQGELGLATSLSNTGLQIA